MIDVIDSGPGLPDGAAERLFDRFYRADPSRARKSGGSGLGLAIAERFIDAQGGHIDLINLEPHGFEARVVLPNPGGPQNST